ncbi:MAG: alpha/beta hydrolase [Hyphomicrobiaceae bacterium]|nr:alpha/beta hydrolase [Hyphomicrobiaceae bacterium]
METLDVRGTPVEVHIVGSGPPLLYLHAEQFFDRAKPNLEALARTWRVIAPRHPGFGEAAMPADFRSVDDIAYLYHDLLDQLGLDNVTLVGASFGGWIALEMCVRNCARLSRLALISSLGVKFSGREERDFADIFYLNDTAAFSALFADPGRFAPSYETMSMSEVQAIARERQALAYYGWKPYLHNPILKRWLHRVSLPTLVLWGEADGFAKPEYGHKLASAIPAAELKLIPRAGHYPQIEQSEAVVRALDAFARK